MKLDNPKKVERAHNILRALKKLFPNPKIALRYGNHWELLVAVILSAQCTDKKVNEVTEKLFKKYRTLNDYVHAKKNEFERDIHSTGFYRNKAKHILASAKIIQRKYKGRIPDTMDDLCALPGVARKTANIVLGNAYGIVEGIAVDTHVRRLARRFGLTKEHNPEKIEKDLMRVIPRKDWFKISYLLIEYGRKYCAAKKCPADHPLHAFDARGILKA